MKNPIKSAIAILAVSALPLIAVAPASASVNPNLSNITLNCLDDNYAERDVAFYGPSVTVTLLNCQSFNLWDWDNTGNASIDGTTTLTNDQVNMIQVDESPEVITLTGPANLEIWDYEVPVNGFDVYLNFIEPYDMPNPSGAKLLDRSQTIPLVTPDFSFGTQENIDNGDELYLGGVESCTINPGRHIYATEEFTVNTGGDYTFRVTGVSPTSGYLTGTHDEAGNPMDDVLLAIYRNFDPTNPNSGVIGCNDDLRQLVIGGHDYDDNHFNLTQQGDYVEGHMPYFGTPLDKGEYTLVFTTWYAYSSADWLSGGSGDWTPSDGVVYFDVWGPNGGSN